MFRVVMVATVALAMLWHAFAGCCAHHAHEQNNMPMGVRTHVCEHHCQHAAPAANELPDQPVNHSSEPCTDIECSLLLQKVSSVQFDLQFASGWVNLDVHLPQSRSAVRAFGVPDPVPGGDLLGRERYLTLNTLLI